MTLAEARCSTRLTNALKAAGFKSFTEVENLMSVPMGPETIQRLPNLGPASFSELKLIIENRKVVSIKTHTMVRAFEEELQALIRDTHAYNNEAHRPKYPDFTSTKCVEIKDRMARRFVVLSNMYKDGLKDG